MVIAGWETFAETKIKKMIRLKNVAPKTAIRAGPRFLTVSEKLLKLPATPPILIYF